MDRYTAAKARYPRARFHYVGHSNGTYLLASALKEYPAVRFDQVVFAGSVVHTGYRWSELQPEDQPEERWQVQKVLNFVATADWVVAFFPKAFEVLGIQDLGGAGHDGFTEASDSVRIVESDRYVQGGHAAGLQEQVWDSIARFVLIGEFQEPTPVLQPEQALWVRAPARVAPLIWVVIFVLLLIGFRKLLRLEIREWQKTLLVLAYLWLIWTIITKV